MHYSDHSPLGKNKKHRDNYLNMNIGDIINKYFKFVNTDLNNH